MQIIQKDKATNKLSIILMLSILLTSLSVSADCVQKNNKDIMCARYPTGGAALNHKGEARCGWGKCVVNINGLVKCSVVEGGGAMLNDEGKARCLGGCENGRRNRCVFAAP